MSNSDIEAGYAFDPNLAAVYHFASIPTEAGKELIGQTRPPFLEPVFVVETIDMSNAESSMGVRKTYFVEGRTEMSSLFSKIVFSDYKTREHLICIRPATAQESQRFARARDYFKNFRPPAVPEREVDREPQP